MLYAFYLFKWLWEFFRLFFSHMTMIVIHKTIRKFIDQIDQLINRPNNSAQLCVCVSCFRTCHVWFVDVDVMIDVRLPTFHVLADGYFNQNKKYVTKSPDRYFINFHILYQRNHTRKELLQSAKSLQEEVKLLSHEDWCILVGHNGNFYYFKFL